jgi:alanine dehydrogenase
MNIGVVKEIKPDEHRVAMTPGGARELVRQGHRVLVERRAGEGSGFRNEAYAAVGAEIVGADDVWESADLLVKVKEPIAEEYGKLRSDLTLFTYLHLAAAGDLTKALLTSGTTAIAYETVEVNGRLPLLAPMSEAAGRLATQVAATTLLKPGGGRGVIMGGLPGVAPARVVIVGGGVVGYNAALVAVGMRADVWIVERSIDRVHELEDLFQGRAKVVMSGTAAQTEDLVAGADVLIGAVLVPGALAPKVVTRSMLKGLEPGAVLVDVAIDQGGCFETSRPTTHSEPTYEIDGVVHYCVTNMPGAVPVTATVALTNVTFPYVCQLAGGIEDALRRSSGLAKGVNVRQGHLTNEPTATSLGLEHTPLGKLVSGLSDE